MMRQTSKQKLIWVVFALVFLQASTFASESVTENTEVENQEQKTPSAVSQFNKAIIGSREGVDLRNYRMALKYSNMALMLADEVLTSKPKQLAALNYNHGVLLYKANQYEESSKQLKKVLTHYEDLYGKEGIELQPLILQLALASGRDSQPSSKRYFKRAFKLTELHYGNPSSEYAKLLIKEGMLLNSYFSYRKGKKSLIKARQMALALEGESSQLAGWASFNLGKLALARREWDASSDHLLTALHSFELPDKPSNQIELSTHAFLVQAFSEQDEQALATRHCLAIGRMTPFTPDQDFLPIYKKQPKYPKKALRAGLSGWSIVEFDVDEQGFVRDPRVLHKSSETFDTTSVEAALNFRYAPAFQNGKAVATKNIQNRIVYTIAN